MQFGEMLYLDEFRYSGVHEVADYESREVEVQIRIFNRYKLPKGPKELADKLIIRRFGWYTQIVYAYPICVQNFRIFNHSTSLTIDLSAKPFGPLGDFDDYESESGLLVP